LRYSSATGEDLNFPVFAVFDRNKLVAPIHY
jgi:hypothetical protein